MSNDSCFPWRKSEGRKGWQRVILCLTNAPCIIPIKVLFVPGSRFTTPLAEFVTRYFCLKTRRQWNKVINPPFVCQPWHLKARNVFATSMMVKTHYSMNLSEFTTDLLTMIHQQMLEITTMAQGILWNLTESECATVSLWTMACTKRWRSMQVYLFYSYWIRFLSSNAFISERNLPTNGKWHNSTQTTISTSFLALLLITWKR